MGGLRTGPGPPIPSGRAGSAEEAAPSAEPVRSGPTGRGTGPAYLRISPVSHATVSRSRLSGNPAMSRPRMTTRRWMITIAIAAVACAAWTPINEAHDAYRFHKGWETCDVTGMISSVRRGEGLVTMTIGSDDGIACGEVLYLLRKGPAIRYIGKARVISVEGESAVGRIVAGVRGLPVREGDQVAHLTWVKRRWRLCGSALRSISRETDAGPTGDP